MAAKKGAKNFSFTQELYNLHELNNLYNFICVIV